MAVDNGKEIDKDFPTIFFYYDLLYLPVQKKDISILLYQNPHLYIRLNVPNFLYFTHKKRHF